MPGETFIAAVETTCCEDLTPDVRIAHIHARIDALDKEMLDHLYEQWQGSLASDDWESDAEALRAHLKATATSVVMETMAHRGLLTDELVSWELVSNDEQDTTDVDALWLLEASGVMCTLTDQVRARLDRVRELINGADPALRETLIDLIDRELLARLNLKGLQVDETGDNEAGNDL